MTRNLKSLILFSIILFLLLSHFLFPRFITEIQNPIFKILRPVPKAAVNSNAKLLKIPIEGGYKMSAALLKTNAPAAKGLVILIHGIRGGKESFNGLARKLSKAGFHSVAIDLRGHGENTAKHCTFGAKEKRDLSLLIDHLLQEENIKSKIGVWGISLGGAVAMQTMAYDKRLEFAVIESTFSSLRETVHNYFRHFAKFDLPPYSNYLLNRAGQIADFDPSKINPSESCKNIDQNILMIHGDRDSRIPLNNAKRNFENLRSSNKELYIVEGADHGDVWEIGGEEYFGKVFEFLESNVE